ncbi:hypothetical protein IHE45_04G162600 [Dioscorea alata]|uniref:Uncharacterized protein n=1 Tax=Dioscorea alata TaxID=55571 RepID=A0ACB7WI51_DIOAL|nr:hypothetical protein IHE45_04G162600 [Dioscorea alata]
MAGGLTKAYLISSSLAFLTLINHPLISLEPASRLHPSSPFNPIQSIAMAASSATLSISSGSCLKLSGLQSEKLEAFGGHRSQLVVRQSSKKNNPGRLSIRSEYSNGSSGGSGDFFAGFLLGGAICGTLAYVFAPQIRRSLLNEDESGFRRAKRPIYYDEGLEVTTFPAPLPRFSLA